MYVMKHADKIKTLLILAAASINFFSCWSQMNEWATDVEEIESPKTRDYELRD
jgi:hypothetical protein